jgi:hypothetical protein
MGLARRAQGARRRRCRCPSSTTSNAAIAVQSPCGWAAARTQIPLGSGAAGASAALALLDDVHRHRLRRAALHLPPRRRPGLIARSHVVSFEPYSSPGNK